MEKNKNRTDLLAAGRKKLQQYRQKKDGKGSKFSGKAGKSERDADAAADAASSVAKPAEVKLQVPGGERSRSDSNDGLVDSSALHSRENSEAGDIDAANSALLSVSVLPETDIVEATLAAPAELPLEDSGVCEAELSSSGGNERDVDSSLPNEGGSTCAVDTVMVRDSSLETVIAEAKSTHADLSVPLDLVNASEVVATAVEVECMNGEDQVPDEADCSGSKQINISNVVELEGDGRPDLSRLDESADAHVGAVSGDMGKEGTTGETEKTSEPNDVSASVGVTNEVEEVQKGDGHSVSAEPLVDSDESSAVSPELMNQRREDVMVHYSDVFSDSQGFCAEEVQADMSDKMVDMERSVSKDDSFAISLESKVISGADMSSFDLSQLAEVVRGLGEDEFRFLLMTRELATGGQWGKTGGLSVQERGFSDVLERLKEELYLTNCAKDIFHMQLAEQLELQMDFDHQRHQLIDEISIARASLIEVQGKNESLADELAWCRSELQVISSGREELQKKFHFAKAECEEFFARADELQFRLESSQKELSNVSTELADCKGLVAALQIENENLNGCLTSLQLLQAENINSSVSLALMTEERMKLEEEKKSFAVENDNLLTGLADCKGLVAALQVENANLNGTLTLVTEGREKLAEEKEFFVHETKKLSTELVGCKGLVETLQVEIANLNGSVAFVMEERNKLGEEKDYFANENEKQVMELVDCKGLMAGLQVECSKAVDDLKEATLRVEQLTDENAFLTSSLDMYKAKIGELDIRQMKLSSRSEEAGNQVEGSNMSSTNQENVPDDVGSNQIPAKGESVFFLPVLEKPLSGGHAESSPVYQLKLDVYDDFFGFVGLKGRLEQAEKVMHELEKAIEEMHSHSTSLSRSSDKVVAPGVSKLIQAFESKAPVDDHELEEVPSTENQSPADPYLLTKEQTRNMRAVLTELGLEAENASEFFKGERNIAFRELKVQYETLQEQSCCLEEANVELVVLYEIIKQHFCNVEAKKGELLDLYEASRQQEIILKAENTELGKKLTDYKSRISELQRQLDELLRSSDAMSSSINNQMEILQKEVSERASILEQGWNSTVSSVFKAVRKLDASSGNMGSTLLSDTDDNLDLGFHVAASVEAAANLIEDLQEKLEASCGEHVSMCTSYKEMTEKFNEFHEKNEFATGILHMIYGNLWELVNDSCGCVEESESELRNDKLLDPLHFSGYDTLMVQLRKLLGERLQLESINHKLNSDLMDRTKDVEELNKRCLGSDVILKLVEDVEGVIRLEGTDIDTDEPALFLESLIYFLLQKCKEADEQVNLSREELGFKEMKLNELQGQKDHLSFLIIQSENEILIFKESLSRAMEDLKAVRSEIEEKVTELEQSEQRVSSLREKLSIAVAKGKGLIVQRDSLKQSLAETSSELERCWQELQLKDARLLEVETKLKTYSEAGERVDALESELSYIRNSATALRESFLLKDSVLQRIEEILEDLELPEHFHARDIIEKVDWLARSVTGNSLPLPDWDQKGSMGGGSYSDSGFAVMDAWKEDLQPPSNSGEDLRRKYEELQSKFYGLAEQNEMLEQSLMERNNLVQRWEGILDKVNMPSQLRSVEPEDRIEWLGGALSEAVHHCNSLEQKIDNFEMLCGSLTADLEESQRRTSDLEACLQSFTSEKEQLSGSLEILTSDYEKVSEKTALFEVENDKLHNEVTALQEKLDEKAGTEERIRHVEGEIKRLQDLVSDELLDSNSEDVVCGTSSTECLELLLRKLMEKYTNLSLGGVAVDEHITEKANAIHGERRIRDSEDVAGLKKELEEALGDLMHLKGERDRYMENSQSLVREVEALDIKRQELQELLNQEEQKSASVREKLNLAVRKGKSLVQQRDSMRQTIDEVTSEVERLKSEIELRENALSANEQKIKDLTTYQERTEIVESESLFLRYRLAETERILEEKGHTLSMILSALGEIDVGFEFNIGDSVKKVEQIGKLCHDLNVAMTASEHDLSKSKRASELLLAELNEVQERNDGLQEELAKAASELSELSKERDLAEADKHEALSRLEKLSAVLSEERDNQFAELMVLKPVVDQVRKGFFDINNLLGDALSKDLELLHNLEASLKSSLKSSDALPLGGARGGIVFTSSENKENVLSTVSKRQEQFNGNIVSEICSFVGNLLQDFTTEISSFKEKLHKHSFSLNEEVNVLSEIVGTLHKEMASRKHSLESMKGDVIRLESIKKEKDTENLVLCRNISLLYEACKSSVLEIGNWKAQLVGNGLTAGDLRFNLDTPTSVDGGNLFNGLTLSSSEECVRTMVDRLLSVVKDFGNMQAEIVEVSQMEMKSTISNLQKELREKDIQKDRICVELVSQIKEAEATAMSYLQELQPAKARIHELEKQVEDVMVERSMLQQSVKELQDREATSIYLQERVGSLTDALAAKEQEIEALMQALDAEEAQMEDLTNKTEELERALKQKNLDFENAETFRVKAMKKLSITVSKFDELHNLSASLLSEVENLQSQLLDRDAEISFLRQEVTRCTNDALATSQMSNKRNSDDLHDLVTWLDSMVSRVQLQDVHFDDKSNHVLEFKEILQKQIMSIISELEDLQAAAQSRDNLLQVERSRVEELARIGESLENSLREKESQLTMLRGVVDPGQGTSMTSEIVEVEPIINKWSISGPSVAPQVRSLRKVNNDQVAIVMDMDPGSGDRLEDEDDDKAHGFKSLTTSKIIPRFTRPVTDMIDGLWVSCDRALMRQPAVRLGVIIYWVVLHALLATFVV